MRPLRMIYNADLGMAPGEARTTHATARMRLGIAPTRARLMAHKLKYATRLSARAPPYLKALVQSPSGGAWRHELIRALVTLQGCCATD